MALVKDPIRIDIACPGTEDEGCIGIVGVVEVSDCQGKKA